MDRYLDHALVCSCGGDRTLRHHAIRDTLFCHAKLSQNAVLEKAGLLPLRHEDEPGPIAPRSARRPADVWLPRGPAGRGAAVDLAVTSGLQQEMIARSGMDSSAVLADYEEKKKNYLQTAQQCESAGFDFIPFVVEAHGGGLGCSGKRLCGFLASSAAVEQGQEVQESAGKLHRRLSVALQRETARAVLRRLHPSADARASACPQGWMSDPFAWQ